MKKNRNIIIFTIVLAVLALALALTSKKFTIRKALSDFAVEDTSSITKIFLSDKFNHSVTLARTEPFVWKVNNKFIAQKDNIDVLLKTIRNVQVREPVSKSAHNTVVKLLAGRAVKIEIYQKVYRIHIGKLKLFQHEKLTKCYYVGDATMDNQGTFMLIEKSTEPFICHLPNLRGFLTTRYSAKETDWRDHTLFPLKPQDITQVQIEFPEKPEQSFRITHIPATSTFIFSNYQNAPVNDFDTIKVVDLFNSLTTAKYEALLNDLVPAEYRDSVIQSRPLYIFTIKDRNNKTYVMKSYHKKPKFDDETNSKGVPLTNDPDRMNAMLEFSNDFILVQYYAMENLLKPAAFYRKQIK